ncbi:UDP-N-acetylmuramoyl-L-alanine--D-glutamate ligase [Lysobacter korlensis]|uniref:UDP-N-acetylmuramoylalanine--D-glutamate ligase n=1 Tax=Lysobacter korlensis TaxID=553636 RepID=A0ABV6S0D8_9GAMM
MAVELSGRHEHGRRPENLTSWHADWSSLRVVVLGAGVTGFAAADTLAELGARVLVVADQVDERTATLLEVIGVATATVPEAEQFDPELVIVSPGFRPGHPFLRWAERNDVAIWGDIELAWRLRDKVGQPAEWILVTGTNGKTTTTQLAATMILASGRRVAPCGNIGIPVLDAIRDPAGFDVLVVELSSFQLHWVNRNPGGQLVPHASVCLNIADDHLDWHGGAEAYRAAKGKVYDNTKVACVYNRDDDATRILVEEADVVEGARAIGFTLGVPGPSDFGIVEGILCDRAFLEDRRNSALELTTVQALAASGLAAPHFVANVLAAAALTRSIGVEPADIRRALEGFRVDAHRTQQVAETDGVRWIDDSKATNPHAADASLRAFPNVVWIVGGLLKGVEIGPLVKTHAARLTAAVLIGADRTAVLEAFARHAPALPLFEVSQAETGDVMREAVRLSAAVAKPGDVVLLAPAAASMDQFTDYADRGNRFAEAVRLHLEGPDDDDDPTRPSTGGQSSGGRPPGA